MLFTIVCLLFLDPILYFFGASEATLPYAKDYMVTILLGNVITHMYLGLNSVLRSAGHPQKAMAATILTVIVNTLLDPLFIYTFHMGIKGAAVANCPGSGDFTLLAHFGFSATRMNCFTSGEAFIA